MPAVAGGRNNVPRLFKGQTMKTSRSPRSERSSSRLKTRLLSATALAAAGGLLAQPAAAGGVYRYDASIPYSDNVVVDTVMTTIYAINGVEAAFAGTVTYQAGGSGILHIGDFPQPDGTILFAPTSIVSQIGNPVLHLNGGTLKLGNAIARNFLANTAELELTGGTLDLNGGNLSVQRLSSPHGSTRITNNAAGTNAILTIQATGSRDVSSAIVNGAGGAGGLGVHIEGSGSVRLAGDNGYTNGTRLVSSNPSARSFQRARDGHAGDRGVGVQHRIRQRNQYRQRRRAARCDGCPGGRCDAGGLLERPHQRRWRHLQGRCRRARVPGRAHSWRAHLRQCRHADDLPVQWRGVLRHGIRHHQPERDVPRHGT
ncbi:hypothetical protein [Bosea thiooxidans]|uniref:hypothetical protein n=1 Tax=Bosea thiooxidans TaxID=53254 RepID=UPI0020C163D2|nr:hypothetical protein [Bosea thiooxidans]